jgi:ketosteroid isomerase-like protein
MNTDGTHADTAIRDHIDAMTQAIREKDVESLMTHYAPDVVVSDLTAPLDVQGADAYRKKFERWFGSIEGPVDYEMDDLNISVDDDVGQSLGTAHVRGTRTNGHKADYCVRVATEFRKVNGHWLVRHEQISLSS